MKYTAKMYILITHTLGVRVAVISWNLPIKKDKTPFITQAIDMKTNTIYTSNISIYHFGQ